MIRISTVEKIVFSFLLFIAALLLLRIMYANNLRYVFLMWNLFLAWIPFQLGIVISGNNMNSWIRFFLCGLWLLFFPNALYIITDLIHLGNNLDKTPIWFDAILLFTSAVTGLLMAFVSLYQVEKLLRMNFKPSKVDLIVAAVLFAGSFGVYLGRFLRWNSWDILANPVSLMAEIMTRITNPVFHYRTWFITLLLTCFLTLLYYSAKKLSLVFSDQKS